MFGTITKQRVASTWIYKRESKIFIKIAWEQKEYIRKDQIKMKDKPDQNEASLLKALSVTYIVNKNHSIISMKKIKSC